MAFNVLTQYLQDKLLTADDPNADKLATELRRFYLQLMSQGIEDIPINEAIAILKGDNPLNPRPIFNSINEIIISFPKVERQVIEALYNAASNKSNGTGILTYEQIKQIVWKDEDIDDTTLPQTIGRIRKKLTERGITAFDIKNIRNEGYQMVIHPTEG